MITETGFYLGSNYRQLLLIVGVFRCLFYMYFEEQTHATDA